MTDTPPAGCTHAICLPLNGDACQLDGGVNPDGHVDHLRRQLAEAHARLAVVTRDRDTFREVARSNQRHNAVLTELLERVRAFADELPAIHGERLRGLLSAPTSAERGVPIPEPTPNPAQANTGCPVKQWDGPYQVTCGLGAEVGVCARHGRFRDRETG